MKTPFPVTFKTLARHIDQDFRWNRNDSISTTKSNPPSFWRCLANPLSCPLRLNPPTSCPCFPFSSLSVTLEASQHGPKSLSSPLNSLRLLSWTEVNSSCKICEDTLAPSSWQCVLMVFLPHPLALFDKTRSPFEGKGTCLKDLWVQGENWKQKVKVYQKWTLSNTAKCFLAVLCCAYDADSVLLILANWDVDRS